jgi:hypothetical protein
MRFVTETGDVVDTGSEAWGVRTVRTAQVGHFMLVLDLFEHSNVRCMSLVSGEEQFIVAAKERMVTELTRSGTSFVSFWR